MISVTFPQHTAEEAYQLLGDNIISPIRAPHLFTDLVERFNMYYSGQKVAFPDKLDLSWATPFQRKVWLATRLIPYGETRSYGWVAKQIKQNGAARATGQALGKNPLPIIIPCHRVIASNGNIGGFSSGIEMKKYLLSLETLTNTTQ
ncbi:MAG: MGMT family protein [Dehalococcoidales bacterium]|nr:MGMT family protein [Dehalococcoidales bacterium]